MKQVLITGKESYIGTKVKEWFASYPDKYMVEELDMIGSEWRQFSFTGFDTVYHVAGIAHRNDVPDSLYEQVNHLLAVEVAEKAEKAGVKQFIFMSSGAVYSQNDWKHKKLIVDEDSAFEPSTAYGISKMNAEKDIMGRNFKMNVAILRPPMVYGPGAKGNYNFLKKIALSLPFFPYIKNTRSMIFIDNLCEFVRMLVDSGVGGIFLPQNKDYVNTSILVREIATNHGKRIKLVHGFGWAISIMGRFLDPVNKAFGSYYYINKNQYFNGSYQIVDFKESIRLTETE